VLAGRHDVFVTTGAGAGVDDGCPAFAALDVLPAPSAGSCPEAICAARPPVSAADATNAATVTFAVDRNRRRRASVFR
jgi:hypothetical protein